MSYKKILDSTLTAIADAIRAKTGNTATMTPTEMPDEIASISGGGGDETLTALIQGTASGEITLNDITTLGVGLVFDNYSNSGVTILNMPDLITCNGSTTEYADGPGISGADSTGTMQLHTINLPACTFCRFPLTNGSTTASKLQSLTALNAPVLETLAGNLRGTAFTEISLPELTSISYGGLAYCTSLTSASLPKLQSLPSSMFEGCTALVTVETGDITSVLSSVFKNCSKLEGPLDFTNATMAASYTYICYGCTALEQVEFQNSGSIGRYFFQGSGIKALIIRSINESGVLSLAATNALTSTPIADGTGYIYVPSDLVETYQAATNWSTYADQFRALEDYTDDGTVNGTFVMPTE